MCRDIRIGHPSVTTCALPDRLITVSLRITPEKSPSVRFPVAQKYPGLYYFLQNDDFCKLLISKRGRRGGDRTHNNRLRMPVLYPAQTFHFQLTEQRLRAGLNGLKYGLKLEHAKTLMNTGSNPYSNPLEEFF